MPLAAAGDCPRDALVALIALGSLGLLIFIFVLRADQVTAVEC
jgi:hypothetical protein